MTATPFFLAQSQQYLLSSDAASSLAGNFGLGKRVHIVAETLGLAATLSGFGLTALMMGLAM